MNTNKKEATESVGIILKAIGDKKGSDIAVFDVSGLSSITDYVVIASGLNAPHLKALAQEVISGLKKNSMYSYRKSGDPDSGWIIVDCLDVMIHLFSREQREYYDLDDLFKDAPRLNL